MRSMRRALRSAHSGMLGLSVPQNSLVDRQLRLRLGRFPECAVATVQQEMRAGVLWSLRHGVAQKGKRGTELAERDISFREFHFGFHERGSVVDRALQPGQAGAG